MSFPDIINEGMWGGSVCQGKKNGARRRTVVWADGAALVVGNHWVGAVGCVLADHLVAHNGAAVAHADLAWLWFPDVPVIVDLAVQCAAATCAYNEWNSCMSMKGEMSFEYVITYTMLMSNIGPFVSCLLTYAWS